MPLVELKRFLKGLKSEMRSFFSKFQFKWWSWELDAVKVLPALLILLSFLPVLPYEKKDGKLISVLGFEAGENNFYIRVQDFNFIGITSLEGKAKVSKGSLEEKNSTFYKINKLYDSNQVDYSKHTKYLLDKGLEKKLAECIVVRDLLLHDYSLQIKIQELLNKYPPTPPHGPPAIGCRQADATAPRGPARAAHAGSDVAREARM